MVRKLQVPVPPSNKRGLLEAYLRIRELLEGEGAGVDAEEPWHGPGVGEEMPALASSTDLLIAWRPESSLLSEVAPSGLSKARSPGLEHRERPPAFAPASRAALSSAPSPLGQDLLWNDDAAEAAVDCLFEFVHALERRDVEAAMSFIAADYHAMEGDREIDATGLRLQLENMLDRRRSGSLRVSLAEVPEPIFHPNGILLLAHVQIDHTPPEGRPECLLLSRVAVLNETNTGRWRISALSPIL